MEDFLRKCGDLWKNGMGLHSKQFQDLSSLLIKGKIKKIAEFGSGGSTEFLCKFRTHYELDYSIVSFDHNEEFCYQKQHDFLDLKIRNLVKCSDLDFDLCFVNKKFERDKFQICQEEKNNFRIKNSFYDVQPDDIPDGIDLVILDGPNGNGRSLAFPLLMNKISSDCWILIDDENHYDFLERCKSVFQMTEIKKISDPSIHPLFSYCLAKIHRP